MRWWLVALVLGAVVVGAAVASCDEQSAGPYCGDGTKDPGEECDDGNKWNNDGCSSVCMLEIAHTVLTANVGINRGVVPGYAGDACSALAKVLVIDGTGPDGYQLEHQELDCSMGYNGWPFYDIPGGHYVITMQLFTEDTGGSLVALTSAKDGEVDVVAGSDRNEVYVDLDFRDFNQSFTGNLKWQYDWSTAPPNDAGVADGGLPDGGTLVGVKCAEATPPVSQIRITLRNEQGQVVNELTSLGTPTTGNQRKPCHDFGASDAEVVSALPWGIYEITLEGLEAANSVAFCARRALFNTKGDGVIFHVTGLPGTCQ